MEIRGFRPQSLLIGSEMGLFCRTSRNKLRYRSNALKIPTKCPCIKSCDTYALPALNIMLTSQLFFVEIEERLSLETPQST